MPTRPIRRNRWTHSVSFWAIRRWRRRRRTFTRLWTAPAIPSTISWADPPWVPERRLRILRSHLRQQCLHPRLRGGNALLAHAGAELDHEEVLGPPESRQHVKVDASGTDRLVVMARRVDVVQVKPQQARGVVLELLAVADEAHLLLEVGVP